MTDRILSNTFLLFRFYVQDAEERIQKFRRQRSKRTASTAAAVECFHCSCRDHRLGCRKVRQHKYVRLYLPYTSNLGVYRLEPEKPQSSWTDNKSSRIKRPSKESYTKWGDGGVVKFSPQQMVCRNLLTWRQLM